MRLLIVSDIHANLDALEACLKAAPEYDGVANLGDIVGYGGCPNEVVERVQKLGDIFVRGNHDRACSGLTDANDFNPIAYAAATWTSRTLTEANRQWVRDLPQGPITDPAWPNLQFVHGSPLDEDEYIMSIPTAQVAMESSPFSVTFFGHTHVQGVIGQRGRELFATTMERGVTDKPQSFEVKLEENARYLVNPGSVGQPRDGDPRAGFAVYDADARSVTLYRVPYDVTMAQQRIISAGLPDRLATRLSDGR